MASMAAAGGDPSSAAAKEKKKLAIFASGGGSNFCEIHKGTLDKRINGSIEVLVSDKKGKECGAIAYAMENGIPWLRFPDPEKPDKGLESLIRSLKDEHGVDFILLTGYLRLIPAELIREYPRSMLNIHPALLPSFGGKGYHGMNVHKAVVASGVRVTGATVHFLNESYDQGPIVAQASVPVYPTDSPGDVANRVLKQEHELYPSVVAALCSGRIGWREDGIPVMWSVV